MFRLKKLILAIEKIGEPLSKYQDILGKPGQGFHQKRLFGYAFNDILGTIVIAEILSKKSKKKFLPVLIFVFLLGELLHALFHVQTKLIQQLKK